MDVGTVLVILSTFCGTSSDFITVISSAVALFARESLKSKIIKICIKLHEKIKYRE